jgi:acyl-CoA synthetase (AMP-forming)/AMP-acid ligase II
MHHGASTGWRCVTPTLPADTGIPNLRSYEAWIGRRTTLHLAQFDERSAAALCYTSGTTGNPKGALYSHRSTVLHAYAGALPDALNLSARDACCRWCRCSTSTPGACPMAQP